jgi:hypothetical protein
MSSQSVEFIIQITAFSTAFVSLSIELIHLYFFVCHKQDTENSIRDIRKSQERQVNAQEDKKV